MQELQDLLPFGAETRPFTGHLLSQTTGRRFPWRPRWLTFTMRLTARTTG